MLLESEPPAVTGERRASHLVELPGGPWAAWRWACLRGAGLPVARVLELASGECAAGADALLRAEEDQPAGAKDAAGVAQARAAYLDAFRRGRTAVSAAIHGAAADDRFREAVLWQNRRALHEGIESLLRKPPGSTSATSRDRQNEELVATFVQRYCTKNETIGFFGPVGWARLHPGDGCLDVRPGDGFVTDRKVYFEVWCIDALAETLARDPRCKPWLTPRLPAEAYVEGDLLHLPGRPPLRLGLTERLILEACDGARTVSEIAEDLVRSPSAGLQSVLQVYATIESLHARGVLAWVAGVPVDAYPERSLRRQLERVSDERLRTRGLRMLDELEAARGAVAAAVGDAARLDTALARLESIFSRLTGADPAKKKGHPGAGRALVYEDCRRDVELHVGGALLAEAGPPLALLLASARWMTSDTAARFGRALDALYGEAVAKQGRTAIPLASVWPAVQALLFGSSTSLVELSRAAFQEKWSRILPFDDGARRAVYRSADLREAVAREFAAASCGWPSARHHSPDLLLAAAGAEAVRAGNYEIVLGELHVGVNTIGTSLFVEQSPAPGELFAAIAADVPEPRVVPLVPKWLGAVARTSHVLLKDRDVRLETSAMPRGGGQARTLPLGALLLEASDAGLIVRPRDEPSGFPAVEAFAEVLMSMVANQFQLLPRRRHTPRVTVDRLVVWRESWTFSPSGMAWAAEQDEPRRFLAARRWAREHGLPRFVFVRTPLEKKPLYLDFDSPVYVNIIAKSVRRAGRSLVDGAVTVTEMLPSPAEAWLPDGGGQRYTSELRLVAVDLQAGGGEKGVDVSG